MPQERLAISAVNQVTSPRIALVLPLMAQTSQHQSSMPMESPLPLQPLLSEHEDWSGKWCPRCSLQLGTHSSTCPMFSRQPDDFRYLHVHDLSRSHHVSLVNPFLSSTQTQSWMGLLHWLLWQSASVHPFCTISATTQHSRLTRTNIYAFFFRPWQIIGTSTGLPKNFSIPPAALVATSQFIYTNFSFTQDNSGERVKGTSGQEGTNKTLFVR